MEFNEKLQQLRKQQNLTQEELAEKLYVSRAAVSKWESGRGYPSIDSLRSISLLFSVSIDDLLSGEELITVAEADNQENKRNLRSVMLGSLDCMPLLLFILPCFAQQGEHMIVAVSLLTLTGIPSVMRAVFLTVTFLTVISGIAQLALQRGARPCWSRIKTPLSCFLTISSTLIFIAARQPYAAIFSLALLIIKGFLLIKQR